MNYITGVDRNQIAMQCMENRIAEDNAVRVIEALVNAMDLEKLKFMKAKPEYKEGTLLTSPTKAEHRLIIPKIY